MKTPQLNCLEKMARFKCVLMSNHSPRIPRDQFLRELRELRVIDTIANFANFA